MAGPPTGLHNLEPLEEEVCPGSPDGASRPPSLRESQHWGSILILTCYLPTPSGPTDHPTLPPRDPPSHHWPSRSSQPPLAPAPLIKPSPFCKVQLVRTGQPAAPAHGNVSVLLPGLEKAGRSHGFRMEPWGRCTQSRPLGGSSPPPKGTASTKKPPWGDSWG